MMPVWPRRLRQVLGPSLWLPWRRGSDQVGGAVAGGGATPAMGVGEVARSLACQAEESREGLRALWTVGMFATKRPGKRHFCPRSGMGAEEGVRGLPWGCALRETNFPRSLVSRSRGGCCRGSWVESFLGPHGLQFQERWPGLPLRACPHCPGCSFDPLSLLGAQHALCPMRK